MGLLAVPLGRKMWRIHKASCPTLDNPNRYFPAVTLGELKDGYQGIDCLRCGGAGPAPASYRSDDNEGDGA